MNMSIAGSISRQIILVAAAFVCSVTLSGCDFEAPVTATPTRKVDARILGEWAARDGKGKGMTVGRLNDSVYIVFMESTFLEAYHSDVGQIAFVSVVLLGDDERKYAYLTWTLSEDGTQLDLRNVKGGGWRQDGIVPPEVSKDSTRVQKFLIENLQNPDLFETDVLQFTKVK